ncbi:DUF6505 family protein [Rhodocyclaceae bacterium SMB388]
MKLLRVARLDDTDDHVFAPAAQAGELAVTGSFVFAFSDEDPEQLTGKARQAFRNGFLSLERFGWATVVSIAEVSEAEYKGAIESLARHLVRAFGAPSLDEALPVARQEVDYAASLCEYEPGTMLVLERRSDDEGIHEAFKRVLPQQKVADWQGHSGEIRIWDMFPENGSKA